MKKQVVLVAVAGILLGGILGFWGAGFLTKKRMKKFKARSGQEVLDKRVFRHFAAEADQVEPFARIKMENGARLDSLTFRHRKDIQQVLKQTLTELEPMLNDQQKEKLARMKKRNERFGEKRKEKKRKKRE